MCILFTGLLPSQIRDIALRDIRERMARSGGGLLSGIAEACHSLCNHVCLQSVQSRCVDFNFIFRDGIRIFSDEQPMVTEDE